MVGTKITHLRDGQHKNNSPKGWTGGELYDWHEDNSSKAGELNGQHENNSPKGWMAQKYLSKGMDGWRVIWLA